MFIRNEFGLNRDQGFTNISHLMLILTSVFTGVRHCWITDEKIYMRVLTCEFGTLLWIVQVDC